MLLQEYDPPNVPGRYYVLKFSTKEHAVIQTEHKTKTGKTPLNNSMTEIV